MLAAIVGLAYLPDIAAQMGAFAGFQSARVLTHSAIFAVVAGAALSLALARVTQWPYRQLCLITIGSILLHDALDVLQSSDRLLLWPFSRITVGPELALIPQSLRGECFVFAPPTAALIAWRLARDRDGRRMADVIRATWIRYSVIAAIAAVATGVHYVRDAREGAVRHAQLLNSRGEYGAALNVLRTADRWPSTARPGRAEYLRGEAYLGLRDRGEAERRFLNSYSIDPGYFWLVADLAEFYAAADVPRSDRARLAAPYIDRLQTDFARHPAQPAALQRVQRRLDRDSTAAGSER